MKQTNNIYDLPASTAPATPSQVTAQQPLVLESEHGITLKAGNAVLRLLPNGELQLNGQTIKIQCNATMEIQTPQLRINSEPESEVPA